MRQDYLSTSCVGDNNGIFLSDRRITYTYDQANRLKQVTQGAITTTLAYNGVGDRLSQTVGAATTHYVLDPGAGLTQVLSDGTNTYLYGNDRLAQYQTAMQYFGADGLGSVRQIYDASAQVVGSTRYDPYGNVMSQSGTATSVFAFAGEQYDVGTGLEYLRARYYSSAQGRFTTRDVWEGDPNAPMSYNDWLYVYANAVNLTDPTGYGAGALGEGDPLYSSWAMYSVAKDLKINPRQDKDKDGKTVTVYVPFIPKTPSGVDSRVIAAQNKYNEKIWHAVHTYFPNEDQLQVAKWVKRQMAMESAFNKDIPNGLMQVIPDKGGEAVRLARGETTLGNLNDPDYNIGVGVQYLSIVRRDLQQQDRDKQWTVPDLDTWKMTFAGYTDGPGATMEHRNEVEMARARAGTPTPRVTIRGATPTPCPSEPVLWKDIENRVSAPARRYVAGIFNDWNTVPE